MTELKKSALVNQLTFIAANYVKIMLISVNKKGYTQHPVQNAGYNFTK